MTRKIHKLYSGVDMRSPYFRSACGKWNDLKMTGVLKGWEEVTCKICLKSRPKP